MNLDQYITKTPDFPKAGILFRDISNLVANPRAYQYATNQITQFAIDNQVDVIVGPEARGFLVGCPVANQLTIGFIPVRKKGKLPGETVEISYDLEYGSATLEMVAGSIKKGQRVLICDDLLATGGTIEATTKLIEQLGGVVAGIAFYIELTDLNGREKLKNYDILSLLQY